MTAAAATPRVMAAMLIVAVLAATGGCNRSPYDVAPVSGRITLKGQPIGKAAVMFFPIMKGSLKVGKPGHARLADDGSFELSTYGKRDGAVVGMYGVVVFKVKQAGDDKKWRPGMPKPTKIEPEKKYNPLTDWDEVRVPGQREVMADGENHFEIDLTDDIVLQYGVKSD